MGSVVFRRIFLCTSLVRFASEHDRARSCGKKCLEMFAENAEKFDVFLVFYEQFGKCLKLGNHGDDSGRRGQLARRRWF